MRFTSIALVIAVIAIVSPIVASAQPSITIDLVTNLRDDSTIPGGTESAIVLRYNTNGAQPSEVYWPANAWAIYSPDGADWGSVQAEVLPAFGTLGFPRTFLNHFHKTGGTGSFGLPMSAAGGNTSGIDTAAVLIAALSDDIYQGMPTGFNDVVVQIKITPSRADAGLHVCIDTCAGVPGGTWEWASAATGAITPTWDGARCFTINCCAGHVGDVDGVNGDEPTLNDISRLIDIVFLTQTPPDCLEEADVNMSGTTTNPPLGIEDITLGDISYLIGHVFVDGAPLSECP